MVGCAEGTGSDDGAVCEQVDVQEGLFGEEGFVQPEEDEENETDDYHGDDVAGFPALRGGVCKGEGEEEDGQTGGEEEHSEGWRGQLGRLN